MQEVEFLKFIIESLVSHKEDIVIDRVEDELWILLTLSINPEDMWPVIWKAGNTISSIRTLLKIVGTKMWKRINLKVLN